MFTMAVVWTGPVPGAARDANPVMVIGPGGNWLGSITVCALCAIGVEGIGPELSLPATVVFALGTTTAPVEPYVRSVTVPADSNTPEVTEGNGTVGLTLAVKVTACPYADGFRLELRIVVVGAGFTVCKIAAEVLGKKFESPL
jgi:hypothetical protein